MLTAREVLPHGHWSGPAADHITLDHDARHRRRWVYTADHGTLFLLDLARDHGLEGIVCKRTDSTYQPGRRSPAWIKTALRRNTEAVVAGWLPGTGPHRATFGSLVLGAHDDDGGAAG